MRPPIKEQRAADRHHPILLTTVAEINWGGSDSQWEFLAELSLHGCTSSFLFPLWARLCDETNNSHLLYNKGYLLAVLNTMFYALCHKTRGGVGVSLSPDEGHFETSMLGSEMGIGTTLPEADFQ